MAACVLVGVGLKLMEGTRGFHLYLCRAQSQVLCAVSFRERLVPAGLPFQPGGAAALLEHKVRSCTALHLQNAEEAFVQTKILSSVQCNNPQWKISGFPANFTSHHDDLGHIF